VSDCTLDQDAADLTRIAGQAGRLTGIVHSIESCGTLDGPGLRFVLFLQGCHYRCLYCHNPDARAHSRGENMVWTPTEAMKEVLKYKNFMRASGGGLTVSGGEPLLQAQFVKELFRLCRKEKIPTALDTTGSLFNRTVRETLDYTDLVLLDIKSTDQEVHRKLTGARLEPVMRFYRHLQDIQKPHWIRSVIVPGYTDSPGHFHHLGQLLHNNPSLQKVELLPFHKMGEYKWEQLNIPYALKNTDPPPPELMKQAISILNMYNIPKIPMP
jgi:pyruvate formate lyase activating enzyme